jgi:hypothetical protein
MRIERRRDYRFSVRLSARVRRISAGSAEPLLEARVADLSPGGASLRLDAPPDWKLEEISASRPGLRLELDLGAGGGPVACSAKLVRVEAIGEELELGVRFAWESAAERSRLTAFLDRFLEAEADGETRRLYAEHCARRRRQGLVVAGLFVLTGVCLVVVFCSLTESLPGWCEDLMAAFRSEARQAARGAAQDEVRRLGNDPGATPPSGREPAPEEGQRLREMLREDRPGSE